MRVHELAKELGLSSKAVMDILAGLKVQTKSHSSSLDEATVERVRRQAKSKTVPQPAPAPSGPVRVAKTPTGERILGMRKIVLPPPPPPAPEPQPEAAAPAASVAPLQAPPPIEAPKAPPTAEPQVPSAPPAGKPKTPEEPRRVVVKPAESPTIARPS